MMNLISKVMPNENHHVKVDWELICRQHHKRLYFFIYKRVSNHEDAEDIEQMTWLEVMRNRDKFIGASRPETWVFGIALNLVRNHFKTLSGKPCSQSLDDDSHLQLIHNNDPSDIIEQQRLLHATMQAVDKLPQDTKQMLSMLVEKEGSYQQVASYLNIPIGTVRSRLSRTRQALKQSLM